MIQGQINGIYDIEYFDAENNEYSNTDSNIWWSSSNDFANTSEFVEIDLGRRRGFNYISFDILRKPIDIEIQYDQIDLANIGSYSNYTDERWRPVKKINGELFTSNVFYEADITNPWKHCEFYFTDEFGSTLVARRLRLKFTRRDDEWPIENFENFAWTVDVKNLRVGRYISKESDLRAPVIDVDSFSKVLQVSPEIKQNFTIPENFFLSSDPTIDLKNIGGYEPSLILPKISEAEFLVFPEKVNGLARFDWEILDVTHYDIVLDRGSIENQVSIPERDHLDYDENGEVVRVLFYDPAWMRIRFNHEIECLPNHKYQLKIRNLSPEIVKNFFVLSPNQLSSGPDASVDLFELEGEELQRRENTSLVFRISGNVGSAGKDVLGNQYQEGVRYSKPEMAIDEMLYTAWTCAPNPSPDGVEALYFDVRNPVGGIYQPSVIDVLKINTLTQGVKMNVYYSEQEMDGPPDNIEDWESILWTPVRNSFKLDQKQTIELPTPIKANWVCLEFYNLQPIPLPLSNYPILPAVEYKEFPDWVYDGNPSADSEDEYLQKEKFVSFSLPEIFAPSVENSDGLRTFVDKRDTLLDTYQQKGFGSAEAESLSEVSFARNQYVFPTISYSNTKTALGSYVYEDYVASDSKPYIAEAQQYPRVIGSRSVSNTNDRRLLAREKELSLLFNRVSSHEYRVERGRFNKKAYSVTISEVEFLRKDFAVEFDDPMIADVLVLEDTEESPFVEFSSWIPEARISIPVGSVLYVSYTIDGQKFEDRLIAFEPPTSAEPSFNPVDLPGQGGMAKNAIARSGPFGGGATYYRNQDFVIVYDPVQKKNKIKRHDIPARLVIPNVVNSVDRGTVRGLSTIITSTDSANLVELGSPGGPISQIVPTSMSVVGDLTIGLGESEINASSTTYASLTLVGPNGADTD